MIFANGRFEVLAVALSGRPPAAVTVPPVETTVRAELQLAAVVVRREVLDEEQELGRLRIAGRAVGEVTNDSGVAVHVGVVDVEAVIGRVRRVERHREQSLLPAALHDRANVEERGRRPAHHDPARLLDDVELPRLARRRRCVDGRVEMAHLQDAEPGRAGGGAGHAETAQRDEDGEQPQCAAKSGVLTHGPGGMSNDSACR